MNDSDDTILEVRDLKVHFKLDEGILKAVDGVDFTLGRNKTLGLVGESGCGKSATAQAVMRIVPSPGVTTGTINFRAVGGAASGAASEGADGAIDLASLPAAGDRIRSIRGKDITMIFQEPMTSFSPLYTMGNQLMEAILLHRTKDKTEAKKLAVEMMRKVGISNPEKRINQYPHEFSGGMRQRVMIAMALACNPSLLIADEPTTALDVTIQAQVLELMKSLQAEYGMSILFITHDLGVIAEMCDEVAVMYLGKIIESAPVDTLFHDPKHPYTIDLLKSIPKIETKKKGKLASIAGNVPVPLDLKPRCGFADRCSRAIAGLCDSFDVPAAELSAGHAVRCFLYPEVLELHEKRRLENAE